MKIFSNHRKKIEAHRRFGSREFKEKLTVAKNHKRGLSLGSEKGFFENFFSKTGLSRLGIVAGVVIVGAIVYFVSASPYFLITDVSVSGNTRVSQDQISNLVSDLSKKRFLFVPENSFFYLSQQRLNTIFASELPEVREVKSHRSWPNKLTLEVTERTPSFVLSIGDRNYLIDDQGFVIKQVDTSTQLQIIDQVAEDITVGSRIDGKIIPFILSMQKSWPDKITVPIARAKIPGKGATEVEFVSSEGWSVFFSTDRPVTTQLGNLLILLNKQITAANRAKLAYVDLRIAKWAYYCFKDTPCQQTDQAGLEQTAGADKTNGPDAPQITTPNPPQPNDVRN